MFFDLDLRGDALPPKTLCLTYDDGPGRTDGTGPGPKTVELGDYLAGRGIAATFFVIGSHVRANPGIVARLRAGGHLVANHTDTHPTLVSFFQGGGDVQGELSSADLAIGSPSAAGDLTFFRAPYGYWRDESADGDSTTSSVAAALNASGRFPHLVGPVGWDIDRFDWNFWKLGQTAEECGQSYLEAITTQSRGIILLHDSSDNQPMRDGNLAFEMTCWLIPILQDLGYRFVRLDEVPGVISASRVTRQVRFRTANGQWLTCPENSPQVSLTSDSGRVGGRERFGVVPVGNEGEVKTEVVALRAWNGHYLAAHPSGEVVADSTTLEDSTRWCLLPESSGFFAITAQGGSIASGPEPNSIRLHDEPAATIRFKVDVLVEVEPLENSNTSKKPD